MAGINPDAPGNRISWHDNGSVMQTYNGGETWTAANWVTRDATARATANDTDPSTFITGSASGGNRNVMATVIYFPEPYDILGSFIHGTNSSVFAQQWAWSNNTTTGLDGTWTNFSNGLNSSISAWRTSITSHAGITGVTAVRHTTTINSPGSGSMMFIHLYGKPTAATGDRLELWHPTLDQRVSAAWFDMGVTNRGTNYDKQFRVKNLSSTLTANSVTVGFDFPSLATPTPSGFATVSNGGSYASTQSITSLAPGAISGVHTARWNPPSNAAQGYVNTRIYANAASWT